MPWRHRAVKLMDRPGIAPTLMPERDHRAPCFDDRLRQHPDRLLGEGLETELAQDLGQVSGARTNGSKDTLQLTLAGPLEQSFDQLKEDFAIPQRWGIATAIGCKKLEIELGRVWAAACLKVAAHSMVAQNKRELIRTRGKRIEQA
jgi:hypothetical protein